MSESAVLNDCSLRTHKRTLARAKYRLALVLCAATASFAVADGARAIPAALGDKLHLLGATSPLGEIVLDDCPDACIELPSHGDDATDERHSSRRPIRPDDIVLNSDVYVVWNGADGIIALIWDGGRGPSRVIWDDTMEFTEESTELTSRWIVDFSRRPAVDENDPEAAFGVSARNAIRMRSRPGQANERPVRLLVAGAGRVIGGDDDNGPPRPQQKMFSDAPPELVWQPEQSGLVALFTRVTRSKRTVAVLTLVLLWVMIRLAR